jgi:hypothetical protein
MTDDAALPVGRTRVPMVQDVESSTGRHSDTRSGLATRPSMVRRQTGPGLAAKFDAGSAGII